MSNEQFNSHWTDNKYYLRNLMASINLYLILLVLNINLIITSNVYPVIAIYTSGIYRTVKGNKQYDKPASLWTIIDGKKLERTEEMLSEHVERMSSIPLSKTDNRNQKIFKGYWKNKKTVTFQSTFDYQNTPSEFFQIPENVKKEIRYQIEVELLFPKDEL